ncbi:MAG: hypothetical protein NTX45_25300 [Proteobacteria bacterium]|nr:hypothetical protein [Pseudomonadota bacterium]
MIRIFIAGHGRCLAADKQVLPDRVSIMWFGELGKSVTKGFTKAVLRKRIEAIGDAMANGAYSEHYLCDTLQLEATLRVQAFQEGIWDNNTFMVQAKLGKCMRLSTFIAYVKQRWPNEDIELRWAVCRTSLTGGGVFTHDIDANGTPKFKSANGAPALPVGQLLQDVNDDNVWFTRWGANLVQSALSPMPQSTF